MSARVNLPVAAPAAASARSVGGPAGTAAAQGAKPTKGASMVLPNDMMLKCLGRIVLVLLASPCGAHDAELVGKLAMVEDDGSVILDDCTHYAVTYATSGSAAAGDGVQRTVVRKCKRAMVNTKHISCFVPQ
jgi:hypothetical protein